MTPAQRLTKIVDFFYIRPVRAVIPLQTFRYAICGGVNLGLNWVLYAVLYNFILDKEIVRLGFVAISPYIAAFLVVFPITFVTGSGFRNISRSSIHRCGGVRNCSVT